jgi:AAA15 family ATPase/GTPase
MPDSSKPVRVFIAYSDKDDANYKKLEKQLKSKKEIDSWHGRRLTGEEWDGIISPKLEKSAVILMLISPDFLANKYCYENEVKKAVELHNAGRAHVVPILARKTNLEGTSFETLKALPSNGSPIKSREWENKKEAFDDIARGIDKILKKIKESTDDCYLSEGDTSFPFCIKRFAIKDFLCIRDTGLDKIPVDCQWVFITGENGDGKTALLQALAVGLLGNDDREATHLLGYNTRIQIEFKQDGENTIRELYEDPYGWGSNTTDIGNGASKHILGYGISRLKIMTDEAEKSKKDENPALSLYNETEGNFRNIETWLKDQYLENKLKETPQVRRVKEMLKDLMPNVEKVEMEGKNIIYHEKGYKTTYPKASAGSKMIVAMVGDMIIRFFAAQPRAEDISEFKGIVLIDELDLHLHPIWQKKLPGLLSQYFPNVQFWATTHSIVPFMGAPENSIFLKVTRDADVLTKVSRLDIDVKRLLPDTLISSPLFGLEDFIRKGVNDFRSEYLYSEYERNKELEEKLEEAARKFKLPKSSFFDDDSGDTK